MKILRDNKQFKIVLPLYKIHIKKIKNKTMIGYQFSSTLPPFLCSYFNIEHIKEPNLLFYTLDAEIHLTTPEVLEQIAESHFQRQYLGVIMETLKAENQVIPNNLQQEYNELPNVNYSVYDNIMGKHHATAYKLKSSNSFRVTLPNRLFKDKINIDKSNYIQFTINALNTDFLNNYGVVTIDILQK